MKSSITQIKNSVESLANRIDLLKIEYQRSKIN
jgi:hypothetical protein